MKFEWKSCLRLAVSGFILYLAIYYWKAVSHGISLLLGALSPIVVGFSIAYVLNILMTFYERHYFPRHLGSAIVQKTRTPVCVVAAILSFAAIIAAIIMLIVPELISCIKFLVSQIPPFINSLLDNDFVTRVVPDDVLSSLASVNWQQIVSRVAQFVVSGVSTAAEALFSAISSIVSVIITAFISIIFSVYFMFNKRTIKNHSRRLLHSYLPRYENKIIHVFSVVNDCFHSFIVGQSLEAVILGVLSVLGMMIFGFPYPQMIGAFIGFTAIIPVAGPYIGTVVGAVMIMTVSPVKALLFVLFIVVLQQLEGNLIYPKVVGNSMGLPAVLVLAAITIGGGIMGIFGMLIGVPIFASIYRLVREDVVKREEREAMKAAPKPQTK